MSPRRSDSRLWQRFARPGLLAVLVAGLLAACSPLSGGDPPLEKDTFSRLLLELHMWSARYEVTDSLPDGGRDSIFAAHGVQESAFEKTMDYYVRHPERFDALYNGVVDSLNAVQARLREGPLHEGRSQPQTLGIDSLQGR